MCHRALRTELPGGLDATTGLARRIGDGSGVAGRPFAVAGEFTFPIDHIIPEQHRGQSTSENLVLSCPHEKSEDAVSGQFPNGDNRVEGPSVGPM
jgi:HNH endonuclease